MKSITLFMIMCSSMTGQCLEPHKLTTFDNHYNCMLRGYDEAKNKIEEIGRAEVDKHGIFIKFVCYGEKQVKKELGT